MEQPRCLFRVAEDVGIDDCRAPDISEVTQRSDLDHYRVVVGTRGEDFMRCRVRGSGVEVDLQLVRRYALTGAGSGAGT